MSYSYVAYIDESGDPACSGPFRQNSSFGGSSNFLIVGAYVVTAKNDKRLVKLRDDIRDEIRPAAKKRDLHFVDLKHPQQIRYCQLLAKEPARMICVIVNKAHLRRQMDFAKDPNGLYWYACRLLVERISWLCDDASSDPKKKKVKLVFSNRGGTPYQRFVSYLTSLQCVDTEIRWNCIDHTLVDARPHSQLAGLQFADGVTSGVARGIEPQNVGVLEPRYGKELKPIVYKYRNGRISGYGIKVLPDMKTGLSNEQRANLEALCKK